MFVGQVPCSTLYNPGDSGYSGSFGDCIPDGGGGYGGGGDYGGGGSSGSGSSWWDNILKALGIASTTAIQIARAENNQYYLPNGTGYSYGTGPYASYTAAQLQAYASQSNSIIGSSGGLILLLVAGVAFVIIAKR